MPISLRWLTIAECLFFTVFAAACFYIFYFFYSGHQQNQPYMAEIKVKNTSVNSTIDLPVPLPYESYASKIKKRNVFSSSIDSSELNLANAVKPGTLPSHLKVVGIVVGDPTEVILEDTNSRQTFFIRQGHEENGMSIQKVESNQVILNYQGQAVTIPLKESL